MGGKVELINGESGKDSMIMIMMIISCHNIIVTNNHYGPIHLHEYDYIGIFQVKWTGKRNTKRVHVEGDKVDMQRRT